MLTKLIKILGLKNPEPTEPIKSAEPTEAVNSRLLTRPLVIEWLSTDDPHVIAASGYPVRIKRLQGKGAFIVSGYGYSSGPVGLSQANMIAEMLVTDQLTFNRLAGWETIDREPTCN